MTITQPFAWTSTIPSSGTASVVLTSFTPNNGDRIILVNSGITTASFPAGFTVDAQETSGGGLVDIASKVASSEGTAPTYTVTNVTGTNARVYAAVLRATNGFKSGAQATGHAAVGTSGTTITVDPSTNPDGAIAALISGLRIGATITSAQTAWNGGSANNAALSAGRGAADHLLVTSVPSDTKVVWTWGTSAGSGAAAAAYVEAQPRFFALMSA